MPIGATELSVSGKLSRKDLRRLTNATRSGTVGPTTVYYAGVTAPIISAAVSFMGRDRLAYVGLSDYWIFLLSAIMAALAGISWYLIFMRWSYRQSHGRGDEGEAVTTVEVGDNALVVKRGAITTEIGWSAVQEVQRGFNYLTVFVDGRDTILIPDYWFGKDKVRRAAFKRDIEARAQL